MTGFSLRVQDGKSGIWRTLSRNNPLPVEIKGMDDLVAVNGSVTDAANRNEHDIKMAVQQLSVAIWAAKSEAWHNTWAVCGQETLTRRAMVWCAVGLGVLQVVLFILDKVM